MKEKENKKTIKKQKVPDANKKQGPIINVNQPLNSTKSVKYQK